MQLKYAIQTLMRHESLSYVDCENAFKEIVSEKGDPIQTAAFLSLLRAKPETETEISAIVHFLRSQMISIPTSHATLDIVGTGGDCANTINISTGSALLAASCGIKVAKHGNRAVSSQTGSADVLEALGLNIELSAEKISQSIEQFGFGFCYFPNFHTTLLKLKPLRKQLGIPTTINFIGPLLNPTSAKHCILGVSDPTIAPILAKVLQKMGTKRSLVVHGFGLDEISCIGTTQALEITPTNIREFCIDPTELGLPLCTIDALRGGDAKINAKLLMDAFEGKKSAISNTLVLNAAVSLQLVGIEPSLNKAVQHASHCLYSGETLKLLNQLKEFSHA